MPFWVLCKNARIHGEARIAQVLVEVSDLQWDVVCFSETRAWSNDSILDGGHRLICSCKYSKCVGVAILVHKKWTKSIVKVEQISDRVMYVDIAMEHIVVRVVATYFPHVGYSVLD